MIGWFDYTSMGSPSLGGGSSIQGNPSIFPKGHLCSFGFFVVRRRIPRSSSIPGFSVVDAAVASAPAEKEEQLGFSAGGAFFLFS